MIKARKEGEREGEREKEKERGRERERLDYSNTITSTSLLFSKIPGASFAPCILLLSISTRQALASDPEGIKVMHGHEVRDNSNETVTMGAGTVDALPPGINVFVHGDLVLKKGVCEARSGGSGGEYDAFGGSGGVGSGGRRESLNSGTSPIFHD